MSNLISFMIGILMVVFYYKSPDMDIDTKINIALVILMMGVFLLSLIQIQVKNFVKTFEKIISTNIIDVSDLAEEINKQKSTIDTTKGEDIHESGNKNR